MRAQDFLIEGATDVLFHYMTTAAAVRTLADSHFSLESSTGTGVEEKWARKGLPWYLATTRSKVGDYHVQQANSSGAMFDLNGQKLGQRYRTIPMDYWEGMWHQSNGTRTSESEDRVLSPTHDIPLRPYVTGVHFFLKPLQATEKDEWNIDRQNFRANEIKTAIDLAQQQGIPVSLYNDKNSWMLQDARRRLPVDSAEARALLGGAKKPETRDSNEYQYLTPWMELMRKQPGDALDKDADRLAYNLRYYGDQESQLRNNLHNAGRDPTNPDYRNIVLINQYMRKNRLLNTKELVKHLKDKWGDTKERESTKSQQGVAEALDVDVPNQEWLDDARQYARSKGRNQFGVPFMGKITAYTTDDHRVPVAILKHLPGMRSEQSNVRSDDLTAIVKLMKDTGKLPLTDRGIEYAPFINVAHNGEAWVNEGNHRIMAAAALGWKDLPVQIKYFDGGEQIKDGAMYPGRIGL